VSSFFFLFFFFLFSLFHFFRFAFVDQISYALRLLPL
jgi:hypothetical protein